MLLSRSNSGLPKGTLGTLGCFFQTVQVAGPNPLASSKYCEPHSHRTCLARKKKWVKEEINVSSVVQMWFKLNGYIISALQYAKGTSMIFMCMFIYIYIKEKREKHSHICRHCIFALLQLWIIKYWDKPSNTVSPVLHSWTKHSGHACRAEISRNTSLPESYARYAEA